MKDLIIRQMSQLREENRELKEQIRQLQDQINVANNINITLENAIDKGEGWCDNSSISKKFMEDAIDEMYNELDDPFTGF